MRNKPLKGLTRKQSPLKHPTHKNHHPSKEELSKIVKKTSIGWPKLKK